MNQTEARATLKSLFPPGDEDLYAWDNPASWVARELEAVTTAVRLRGSDAVDKLRQEFRPHTATEKLPDWERIFGLSQSRGAVYGSLAARRGQVVARWRENGASTTPNIAAALAAVLGYQPAILEHSRAAMTAAHTYALPGTPIAIATNADTIASVAVVDNAPVSRAGARLVLTLTIATLEDLSVTLQGPGGPLVSWPAPFGSGPAVAEKFILYAPSFAGTPTEGIWTITITNSNANAGTVGADSGLFVEGIGRGALGAEGLAANIFEWAVLVDPTQLSSTADLDFARQLVARWNPAHCRGYLDLIAQNGSHYGVFDDPNSRFDGCAWAP